MSSDERPPVSAPVRRAIVAFRSAERELCSQQNGDIIIATAFFFRQGHQVVHSADLTPWIGLSEFHGARKNRQKLFEKLNLC
jgi:hypothetical protein